MPLQDNINDRERDKFGFESGQTFVFVKDVDGTSSASYFFQNLETVGLTMYVGKSTDDGVWQLSKVVDTAGNLATTYASETNNVSYTTYANAWAARASLVYGDISTT